MERAAGLFAGRRSGRNNWRLGAGVSREGLRRPPAEGDAKRNECQARRIGERSFHCGLRLSDSAVETHLVTLMSITGKIVVEPTHNKRIELMDQVGAFQPNCCKDATRHEVHLAETSVRECCSAFCMPERNDKAAKVAVRRSQETGPLEKLCTFHTKRGVRVYTDASCGKERR